MTSTSFRPEGNGFAFANSFQFTSAERDGLTSKLAAAIDAALGAMGPFGLAARLTGVRDGLGRIALSAVPQRYGLCGGMAFAALDYYYSGVAMPRGNGPADQPPPGSDLRDYLWDRLVDSWRLNGATFLEWKARLSLLPSVWPSGAGPRALRDRSKTEWRKLRGEIDAGHPTVLGLVGENRDPFQDHQVLACGYENAAEDVARSSSTTQTVQVPRRRSRSTSAPTHSTRRNPAHDPVTRSAVSSASSTRKGHRPSSRRLWISARHGR